MGNKNKEQHPDWFYVEGILNGDPKVLARIKANYFARISRFILANSGSEEDAQDIIQEAILVVYEKAKKGGMELRSSFYTYLYAVCRNLWLYHLRDDKSRMHVSVRDTDAYEAEDTVGSAIKAHRQYILYQEKFEELSENCKKVLGWFFKKKPLKEIAAAMKVTEAYARKRRCECRRILTEAIQADPEFTLLKVESNPLRAVHRRKDT